MKANHKWNVSFKPLIIGFIVSIALMLMAFWVVGLDLSRLVLTSTVLGLACIQALVQLVLFLHLGIESRPHWNLITFLFMVLVVVVVVGGSLWIMYNLNYALMPDMKH